MIPEKLMLGESVDTEDGWHVTRVAVPTEETESYELRHANTDSVLAYANVTAGAEWASTWAHIRATCDAHAGAAGL